MNTVIAVLLGEMSIFSRFPGKRTVNCWSMKIALLEWLIAAMKVKFLTMVRTGFFVMIPFFSCTWMSPGQVELFRNVEVLKRTDTIRSLKTTVLLHTQICPENRDNGLYAIDSLISTLVTEAFYSKESVDNCVVTILVLPCGIFLSSGFSSNIYGATVKLCGLVPVKM